MSYLTTAVVIFGLATAINLLLTMAIVRRMRHYEERFVDQPKRPPFIQTGTVLPEFAAKSSTGSSVNRDFFTEPTLVGAFSTSCPACRDQLPAFAALANERFAGHALAIVSGDPKKFADLAAGVTSAVTLVTEPADGPLRKAFQVKSVPTFFLVNEDATIIAASGTPAGLEKSLSDMAARL